ncbi:unnamed protein product [Vitrella brassicaformis CCMP3155]|uniref:Dynein regulatory complex subunit 2 n=2 Tax=Vitrella brassicaformis TaxID=1169539 RepID=A0A0G4GA93_VITBC|nr:unnamed protein product [Vitrella brassicaformis CCMP3155]|eukprot:CEM25867.1 unnamed protein product [Vitrella brassicaformis CCMP3155]
MCELARLRAPVQSPKSTPVMASGEPSAAAAAAPPPEEDPAAAAAEAKYNKSLPSALDFKGLRRWPMPAAEVQLMETIKAMGEEEREQLQTAYKKKFLKSMALMEAKNTKMNLNKVQESWLRVMRAAKTKDLKLETEVLSQIFDRDLERKDALLQMYDRDLNESEEQQLTIVRSHLMNIDKLFEIQQSRLEGLEEEFLRMVKEIESEFLTEREHIMEAHNLFKSELQIVVQRIDNEEKGREQMETTEHNTQYELIRNRNIEEDHQMKSRLEEIIDQIKERCNTALQNYRDNTDSHAQEYKRLLQQDAHLSRKVDQKLRAVERMQSSIAHWKMKIAQNKQECEVRNAQLRTEKEQIQRHFQELKAKMAKMREEERGRLADLTTNAKECLQKLQEQIKMGERILRTAELCNKYETEREKVLSFYLSRDVDVDELQWDQEDFREEVRDALSDVGVDEWSYLDTFLKRYNKVMLDKLAIDKETSRLEQENHQLKSILKQFLDGVSVSEEVLSQANPLLIVNGRINLNHIPVKRSPDRKVVIEAATHFRELRAQQTVPKN